MSEELKIDAEFSDIYQTSAEDYENLKATIVEDGEIIDPIRIYHDEQENATYVIDGHTRYRISQETGIPFKTFFVKKVKNRDQAKIWICKNQRDRRNATDWQRCAAVLKCEDAYVAEAKKNQGTRNDLKSNFVSKQTRSSNRTIDAMANDAGVGRHRLEQAKEILESKEHDLIEECENGAKIGTVFKELKKRQEPPELADANTRAEKAEQERDEAKQLRNAANDLYNQASRKATEQKARAEQAERERDEAKNELGAMRVSKGNIEAALDKTNADRAKDRETIAQLEVENERLRNQPQAEPEIRVVEKRIEVIPDEYKKAFMENQRMKKELAAHRAHEQDMTVQELARVDEEFKELQKSYEEEERTSERLDYFSTLSSFFPEGQIEARELVRCFLKFHGNEPAEVHSVQRNLKMAIDSLTWIYDALMKPQLEVVK